MRKSWEIQWKKGDNDFCLWVADFEKASEDCKWTDELQARWLSWFVVGPAKATWQQTLTVEEKMSWGAIKRIYNPQVGIHMDPQTAYGDVMSSNTVTLTQYRDY